MDDVIVNTRRRLLRWRADSIEEVADAGDLPMITLGTDVVCGVGATVLARKMSPPKDFKRQRGTVAVIHLETSPEDRPRAVELGVQFDRGIGWFTPAELSLITDRQEVSHGN